MAVQSLAASGKRLHSYGKNTTFHGKTMENHRFSWENYGKSPLVMGKHGKLYGKSPLSNGITIWNDTWNFR